MFPVSVDEVGGPTILATFPGIAALMPMAFATGLMGPYMSPIPINASTGMLISLVVAFVVTPWLSYKLLHRQNNAMVHGAHGGEDNPQQGKLYDFFNCLFLTFIDGAQAVK